MRLSAQAFEMEAERARWALGAKGRSLTAALAPARLALRHSTPQQASGRAGRSPPLSLSRRLITA